MPRTSTAETARVVTGVLVPLIARGLILRRPRITGLLEAVDVDRRAVATLEAVRRRHGAGPVRLRLPGRRIVLVLDGSDARRVLDGTPEPFTPATHEKRAALDQFEPHGVLISQGGDRPARRRLNEAALETGNPVHGHAELMTAAVAACAAELVTAARADDGVLTWDTFADAWWRLVRTVVLGGSARDDRRVTDDLAVLRRAANWGFLPRRRRTRARFLARLDRHLDSAEPGSLSAALAAQVQGEIGTSRADAVEQVPQWLFAFDAAGMATMRALALLAAHPGAAEELRVEAASRGCGPAAAFARACVQESLRLWPTTPAVLRESTRRTAWRAGPVPEGSLFVIHAPLLHRGGGHQDADRFAPHAWLDGAGPGPGPNVPFSAGPARCAGEDVVLLLTSALLARLLDQVDLTPAGPRTLAADRPLPGTLSPFGLRVRFAQRSSSAT